LILVAPLGKAAGAAGAFIAATEPVVETLIQFAKPYIYSTAMPPAMAETLRTALRLIAKADGARARLQDHIATFRGRLAAKLWPTTWHRSPIQPYVVGDNRQSVTIAKALADRGCWVPAIRPPTVPQGQARLRISLTAAHSDDDIARLCDALDELTAT
jgi:8-amino-7-oxononanoate synthase